MKKLILKWIEKYKEKRRLKIVREVWGLHHKK